MYSDRALQKKAKNQREDAMVIHMLNMHNFSMCSYELLEKRIADSKSNLIFNAFFFFFNVFQFLTYEI